MIPKLGCVPYLNATPLIAWFAKQEQPTAELYLDQPANLGTKVCTGNLDAALASSFFALSDRSLTAAAAVSISSSGPVESVRLFSKVPFDQIESLALDQSSMTSNHLAQIILKMSFGRSVLAQVRPPNLTAMLQDFDAALLIGDNGMLANCEGLYVLDLGEAWHQLTAKPFVWALWVGNDGLTQPVCEMLITARDYGLRNMTHIAINEAEKRKIPVDRALRYLTETIEFDLTLDHQAGLQEFGRLCADMGFLSEITMPRLIGETSAGTKSS